MGKKHAMLQKLADMVDLPGEAIPGNTVIELLSENRLMIEHHEGIRAYSRERILVGVSFGQAEIQGEALTLRQMTLQDLIITGRIASVLLHRRGDL